MKTQKGDHPLVAETQALMRAGATEIRQGGLEACGGRRFRLRGRPDVMRRTPHSSLLGAWSYEPIKTKQHGMATSHDTIQLDFSRWLLTQAQGHTPDGELWLGADADGQPAVILQRSEPLAALECDLRQIAELSSDTEPAIAFARHCLRADLEALRLIWSWLHEHESPFGSRDAMRPPDGGIPR